MYMTTRTLVRALVTYNTWLEASHIIGCSPGQVAKYLRDDPPMEMSYAKAARVLKGLPVEERERFAKSLIGGGK